MPSSNCSCGLTFTPVRWGYGGQQRPEVVYCPHCDRPCLIKKGDCRLCTRLDKAPK